MHKTHISHFTFDELPSPHIIMLITTFPSTSFHFSKKHNYATLQKLTFKHTHKSTYATIRKFRNKGITIHTY